MNHLNTNFSRIKKWNPVNVLFAVKTTLPIRRKFPVVYVRDICAKSVS